MRAFSRKTTISTKIWAILEYIGVDLKGPFPVKSDRGYTGFYLLADRISDYKVSYSRKTQSD
jgi:hypothetical protein